MVAYLDQAGVQYLIAKIRNTFWPVGTILATSTDTSPASYLGGSWEAYAPGRTLVGVSTTDTDFTLNKQGGAKTVDVGKDTDLATAMYIDQNGNVHAEWKRGYHSSADIKTGLSADIHAPINWSNQTTHSGTKVAGTLPIIPPYISVCYWRRVA
jgi:hypothetical protein